MNDLETMITDKVRRSYKLLTYNEHIIQTAKPFGFTALEVKRAKLNVIELKAALIALEALALASVPLTDAVWDARKDGQREGQTYWMNYLMARSEATA